MVDNLRCRAARANCRTQSTPIKPGPGQIGPEHVIPLVPATSFPDWVVTMVASVEPAANPTRVAEQLPEAPPEPSAAPHVPALARRPLRLRR
jgi:hypothetical protein